MECVFCVDAVRKHQHVSGGEEPSGYAGVGLQGALHSEQQPPAHRLHAGRGLRLPVGR